MSGDVASMVADLLGYRCVQPERLRVALTHRSVATPAGEHNETLEFLGDAALGLTIADLLMAHHPEAREGDLSKRRAALVNAGVLARKARAVDLGAWLHLGKGEARSGGREKESILAAAYEALLGAIFLDGGYDAVRTVVARAFAEELASTVTAASEDYKTRLQELTQRRFRASPVYRLVEERGPDHAKHFTVELTIDGRPFGGGTGPSKKAAEQGAAMEALRRLDEEVPSRDG